MAAVFDYTESVDLKNFHGGFASMAGSVTLTV
jgi:hypothetical protein